jgi:DNA anti-recombination protein RmuC
MRTALKNVAIQSASPYFCFAALVLGAVAVLAPSCSGQASASSNTGTPTLQRFPQLRSLDDPRLDNPASRIFAERRLQALNAAQHQAIVDDTDKLVKLVTELNQQINSSNAHSLTPQQQQMVAEIEKLAHSVRDKMRMTVRTVELKDIVPMSLFP